MLKTKSAGAGVEHHPKVFSILIVLEYDEEDPSEYKWTAHSPTLPSCCSEGRTREEAMSNVLEVIAAYLELLTEELSGKDFEIVEVTT